MTTDTLAQRLKTYDLSSCIIHAHGNIMYHYEATTQASSQLMPINSCTKSILSALICIAMEQGVVAPPNTVLSQYYPLLLNDDDIRKQSITIEHLLTLTAGFQWQEFGGLNSFPKMTRTADWVQYILEQPLSDTPGTRMVYNSGVSQLLAAIFVQSTEMTITEYAEQNLFGPLGIERYEWKCDPQGIHTGGFGLELPAEDMLKFGLLYLHNGVWNNQQLIPSNWITCSTKPAIAVAHPERGFYGWHWWSDTINSLHYYYARGFGGQFIMIVPALDVVVVLTRQSRKKGSSPHDLFREYIVPWITRHTE